MITTAEIDYHSMRHVRPHEKEKACHTATCEMFGYDKIPIHVMKYTTRNDATVNNITYQKAIANRIIAMDVNIRDGHVDTACQLVQGVGAVRAELAQGFAYVAQQIAGLEQRTAAGAEPGPNFAA